MTEDLATYLMNIILPGLARSQLANENSDSVASMSGIIFALATASPASFKETLLRLTYNEREAVEVALRTALRQRDRVDKTEPQKPTISLKSAFAPIE